VLDQEFIITGIGGILEGPQDGLTPGRQGNYQYMGWADAAYTCFDQLCNQLCEQCQTPDPSQQCQTPDPSQQGARAGVLGKSANPAGRWR
jgi:hypothetical protein